ncbi:hypothetical protein COCON_G00034970 [Conger conger]|uniref:Uncharacterized protein n=1 Tax=Conger conger TaxID=82655 RepID=A0A9Q1DZH0_CONCO|nr:hypothetical protein COCON_G00034970 [Conger conger]
MGVGVAAQEKCLRIIGMRSKECWDAECHTRGSPKRHAFPAALAGFPDKNHQWAVSHDNQEAEKNLIGSEGV